MPFTIPSNGIFVLFVFITNPSSGITPEEVSLSLSDGTLGNPFIGKEAEPNHTYSIISGLFSFSIGATIPREFGCGKEKNP